MKFHKPQFGLVANICIDNVYHILFDIFKIPFNLPYVQPRE